MIKFSKIKDFFERHEILFSILAILFVILIAYVPSMKGAGFYADDYHILYGGYTSGVEKLLEIAKIDRPIHGITFTMYFPLFGVNIHAYQVFEICLNFFTALLTLWLVRMIWPRQKAAAFSAAVLMSVYPGYIDHMRSFNFSLFMLNLFLYILSIALSTQAMMVRSKIVKVLLTLVSIFAYLWAVLLNEYYIGLEMLRLGIFFVFAARSETRNHAFWKNLGKAAVNYAVYLLAGIGFFIWRFFIFSNQRNATDLGSFTSAFSSSPLYAGLSLIKGMFTNFLNVTVLAWFEPLYKYLNNMRLKDAIVCMGLALLGALIVYLILRSKQKPQEDSKEEKQDWQQMLVIAGLTVLAALFPIVFVNRDATFENYGRYALPGMIGSILLVVGLLNHFVKVNLRQLLIGLAVFSGIFTQLGVGKALASDWQGSKDLWWQLSWRAPSLKPGTLLTGISSEYSIPEGTNLWSPANLIYYPKETNPVVTGETLNIGFIQTVMEDKDTTRELRSFLIERETEKLLVLSKPSSLSCLHLIDGDAPTYSTYDSTHILLIGEYSNLDQVDTSVEPSAPPSEIFGAEPAHDWCYFYQKAELALQKGEFDEVVNLREEATFKNLKPDDASELLPFILAYAETGNESGLNEVLPIFMDYPFHKVNYCLNLQENKFRINEKANQMLFDRSCQSN